MKNDEDVKQASPGSTTEGSLRLIQSQILMLDMALNTIPHYGSEETKLVRSYIIAQIEALKWVMKKCKI